MDEWWDSWKDFYGARSGLQTLQLISSSPRQQPAGIPSEDAASRPSHWCRLRPCIISVTKCALLSLCSCTAKEYPDEGAEKAAKANFVQNMQNILRTNSDANVTHWLTGNE